MTPTDAAATRAFRLLCAATAAPAILPTPGAHRLMLIGSDGRLQDQVLFTVR